MLVVLTEARGPGFAVGRSTREDISPTVSEEIE